VAGSGLYRHIGDDGLLIYVGITKNFLRRQGEHVFRAPWAAAIHHIEFYPMPWEEAQREELRQIREFKPPWNLPRRNNGGRSKHKGATVHTPYWHSLICDFCQKTYSSSRSHSMYCSKSCKVKMHMFQRGKYRSAKTIRRVQERLHGGMVD
jgi:hypothetical protein